MTIQQRPRTAVRAFESRDQAARTRPLRSVSHDRRRGQQLAPFAPALPHEDPLAPARGTVLGAIGGAGLWGLIIWGALQLHDRLS